MSIRTRLKWSLLVIIPMLLAPQSARAVDPKLLPANTEFVVSFNLKQILGSQFAKDNQLILELVKGVVSNALTADVKTANYLTVAEFELFRDVNSITVAYPANADPKGLFAVVQGKFDLAKINAAIATATNDNIPINRGKVEDIDLYAITAGANPIFVGLYNDSTLFVGLDRQPVADAISRANSGAASRLPANLNTLIANNTKQAFGFVATGNALAEMSKGAPVANANVAAQGLGNVNLISLNVTVAKDINLAMNVAAKDQDTARSMKEQADTSFAALRAMIQANENPNQMMEAVGGILNSIQVSQQGVQVQLTGEASSDNLMKMIGNLPFAK